MNNYGSQVSDNKNSKNLGIIIIVIIIIVLILIFVYYRNTSLTTRRIVAANNCTIDVLIIGGGVTGSFLANQLRKIYSQIVLIERESKLGGLLTSNVREETAIDRHTRGLRYFPDLHEFTHQLFSSGSINKVQVPYIVNNNIQSLRGNKGRFSDLPVSNYNLSEEERGFHPYNLFRAVIEKFLTEKNISLDEVFEEKELTQQSFQKAMLDYYSPEMVSLFEDSSGYNLGKHNYSLAQAIRMNMLFYNDRLTQNFVDNGYELLAERLVGKNNIYKTLSMENISKGDTSVFLNTEVEKIELEKSVLETECTNSEIRVHLFNTKNLRKSKVRVKNLFIAVPEKCLKRLSSHIPNKTNVALKEIQSYDRVNISLQFTTSWWEKLGLTSGGKNISDTPMRQIYLYAPKILIIDATGSEAKFWEALFTTSNICTKTPSCDSLTPVNITKEDLTRDKDLVRTIKSQLVEIFTIDPNLITLESISWRYYDNNTHVWSPGNIDKNYNTLMTPFGSDLPVYMAHHSYSKWQNYVEGGIEMANDLLVNLGFDNTFKPRNINNKIDTDLPNLDDSQILFKTNNITMRDPRTFNVNNKMTKLQTMKPIGPMAGRSANLPKV